MEIYLKWLDNLITVIKSNKYIRKIPCEICECILSQEQDPVIRVSHTLKKNKNLIIDSTCFKKYFDAVVEPAYTYEQSIEGASKNCIKYIRQWNEE